MVNISSYKLCTRVLLFQSMVLDGLPKEQGRFSRLNITRGLSEGSYQVYSYRTVDGFS